jgi:hypothetical protein
MAEYIFFIVSDKPGHMTQGLTIQAQNDQDAVSTRPQSVTVERKSPAGVQREVARIDHLRQEIWQFKDREAPRCVWTSIP